MPTRVSCPQCQRRLQVPDAYLGKKVKCPSCGAAVAVERPAPEDVPGLEPEDPSLAEGRGNVPAVGPKAPPSTFSVRVVGDPSRVLKGSYRAEASRRGLELAHLKTKEVVMRVPVGTAARDLGGGRFAVALNGREVTLAVAQMNVFAPRLARDIVEFLEKRRGAPTVGQYTMPGYLTAIVLLPAGIVLAGLSGGAIGGGLGGGIGGGLVKANLAIARKESWPLASRIAACLALATLGYVIFIVAFVAILGQLRPRKDGGNPAAPGFPNPPSIVSAPHIPGSPPGPMNAPGSPLPPMDPNRPYVPPKTPDPVTGIRGLIGYWPLDEGSGTAVADASGHGHEGTLKAPKWVEGIRGGAVRFDGDGFLDYGDSPDFNFARDEPFTIAGWFRSSGGGGPVVSQRNEQHGSPVIDIVLEQGSLTALVREDGNELAPFYKLWGNPVADERWHHFALVRRVGNQVLLYMDGELARQVRGWNNTGGAVTTNLRAAGSEPYWARRGGGGFPYLTGAIDEICVFKRDLDDAEIRRLAGHP